MYTDLSAYNNNNNSARKDAGINNQPQAISVTITVKVSDSS